jgi:hypothetical protein
MRIVPIDVTIGEPVAAAQAPTELSRAAAGWGRWQFPVISRLADGLIHVGFSVEPDEEGGGIQPAGLGVRLRLQLWVPAFALPGRGTPPGIDEMAFQAFARQTESVDRGSRHRADSRGRPV